MLAAEAAFHYLVEGQTELDNFRGRGMLPALSLRFGLTAELLRAGWSTCFSVPDRLKPELKRILGQKGGWSCGGTGRVHSLWD